MSMKKGEKGPHVIVLQGVLQKLDFALASDGVFGAETEEAVKQFQSQMGIETDGIVGNDTADNLVRALLLGFDEVETV